MKFGDFGFVYVRSEVNECLIVSLQRPLEILHGLSRVQKGLVGLRIKGKVERQRCKKFQLEKIILENFYLAKIYKNWKKIISISWKKQIFLQQSCFSQFFFLSFFYYILYVFYKFITVFIATVRMN